MWQIRIREYGSDEWVYLTFGGEDELALLAFQLIGTEFAARGYHTQQLTEDLTWETWDA